MTTALDRPATVRRYAVPGMPRPVRVMALCVSMSLILTAGVVTALCLGEVVLAPGEVLAALTGTADGATTLIVTEFRLPRVLAGVLAGACLAAAGTLLQSVLRNPLASPDVVGVSHGASAGAVLSLAAGIPATMVPLGALAGAALAAGALVVLGWRGGLAGERIVLIGIGLSAVLTAVVTWAVVAFPVTVAQQALLWTIGSLFGRTWEEVGWAGLGAVVLLPVAMAQSSRLAVLELGDDLAHGLGLPAGKARLGLLATAVGLAGSAVALGGPITFVALGVPHLARALAGPPRPTAPTAGTLLLCSLVGAALVVYADLIAGSAMARPVPVGVVTATLGAPWFCWVLVRGARAERPAVERRRS
ncbi:FecCD family ABC transporter permease [Amycolatopsis pigmentata]|uniref:FecCD family ABC transporter permease n=1 Tax=Amycolatopsis pigmentata TaxID=450801 RepID=A0ABW5G3Q3_9PSEU